MSRIDVLGDIASDFNQGFSTLEILNEHYFDQGEPVFHDEGIYRRESGGKFNYYLVVKMERLNMWVIHRYDNRDADFKEFLVKKITDAAAKLANFSLIDLE